MRWNVTGRVAGAAAAGAVQATVGQTLEVSFGLRYTAVAAEPQRQLAGGVQVSAPGDSAVVITHLIVEVTRLEAGTMTTVPLLTWSAVCPRMDSTGEVTAAAGSSITCSFVGVLPTGLVGHGYVTARAQLADGSEAASPAVIFDFSQQPVQTVNRDRCAIVSDQFLFGKGLLQPSRTTRPAAAAAPTQVCNSQSISFAAAVGPFTRQQCGQLLTVSIVCTTTELVSAIAQSVHVDVAYQPACLFRHNA